HLRNNRNSYGSGFDANPGSVFSAITHATRPEVLIERAKSQVGKDISPEDITRMEAEMERLQHDSLAVEDTIGDTMLSLVVAKGFINRLLRNENIRRHLQRHYPDLLSSVTATLDAIAADGRGISQE
ncbi:plasmid partitioning protein RepB C-terminal domain-containing protein, partial [Herbaspirillum frisingense]